MSKAKGYDDFAAGAGGSTREVSQADEEGHKWPARGDALARAPEQPQHEPERRINERPADEGPPPLPNRPDLSMPIEGRPDLAPNAGIRQRNS